MATLGVEELSWEELCLLVDLWREQENLWNTSLPTYHDRTKTRESLLYIASVMNKGWDEHTTQKRLRNMRSSYVRQRKALNSSVKTGSLASRLKKPTLKYYNMLDAFLKPFVGTRGITIHYHDKNKDMFSPTPMCNKQRLFLDVKREGIDQDDSVFSDRIHVETVEDSQDTAGDVTNPLNQSSASSSSPTHSVSLSTYSPSPLQNGTQESFSCPPSFKTPPCKKRKTDPALVAVEMLINMAGDLATRKTKSKTPKSSNEKFGSYVASELDKLPPRYERKAKHKIQSVLFDIAEEYAVESGE